MSTSSLLDSFTTVNPIVIPQIDLDSDRQSWVDQLVIYGLLPKAYSATTCKQYFRELLFFSNHYRRLGKTTCHLMTCRNCGAGAMRAHRMWCKDEARFHSITSQLTRTLWLSVYHEKPCATVEDYFARVKADFPKFRAFCKILRSKSDTAGWFYSVELDAKRRYVAFRVYYIGWDPKHVTINHIWKDIAGDNATAESEPYWSSAADALRWTLDSYRHILDLPGGKRAEWELHKHCRLSNSGGSLRGINIDHDGEPQKDSENKEAPYGYCPCGCGGVIEKSKDHASRPITEYANIPFLDFGPLRAYAPYRSKVNPLGHSFLNFAPPEDANIANLPTIEASPPPW